MTHPIITAEMLEAHTACPEQVGLFRELFPDGARLTKANWKKAIDADLDIWWTECLLTAPARAEYDKVTAAAWAEYDKATAAARAAYDKVIATALLAALRAALTTTEGENDE